jgi:hypothetical protein
MPKCAGTSVIKKILKDPDNISYMSNHDSKSILSSDNLSFAKDWEQYILVRNPYDWYQSWYNYIVNSLESSKHDALSAYLVFNNSRALSLSDYIENATNLPTVFDNVSRRFVSNLIRRRNGYLKTFFGDLRNLKMKHQTQYQFYYNNLASENTKIYRLEDQLDDFLKDTGIGNIGRFNVTKYKHRISEKDKELIKNNDRILFEKFGYDV